MDLMQELPDGAHGFGGYCLKREHVLRKIPVLFELDDEAVLDAHPLVLLHLHSQCSWPEEFLGLIPGWGTARAFAKSDDMLKPLTSVIDYCEGGECSQGIRKKLRFLAKMLSEEKDTETVRGDSDLDLLRCGSDLFAGVLSVLASHGGVCHIQKEIGVNISFRLLSEFSLIFGIF